MRKQSEMSQKPVTIIKFHNGIQYEISFSNVKEYIKFDEANNPKRNYNQERTSQLRKMVSVRGNKRSKRVNKVK